MANVISQTDSACLQLNAPLAEVDQCENIAEKTVRFGNYGVKDCENSAKLSGLQEPPGRKQHQRFALNPKVNVRYSRENYLPDRTGERAGEERKSDRLSCEKSGKEDINEPSMAQQSVSPQVKFSPDSSDVMPLALIQKVDQRSSEDEDTDLLETLVERFLNISIDSFNQDAVVKVAAAKENEKAKMDRDGKKLTDLHGPFKIRMLINSTITKYVSGEIAREEAKNKMLGWHKLAKKSDYDYELHIRNLIYLKLFSDILAGKVISDDDRNSLLSSLSDTVKPGDNGVLPENIFSRLDILSLQVLFNLGALPGFYQYVNYLEGLSIMLSNHIICCKFSYLMSPISFSDFDYFRYGNISIDMIEKVIKQNHRCSKLTNSIQFLVARGFSLNLLHETIPSSQGIGKVYDHVFFELLLKFIDLVEAAKTGNSRSINQDVKKYKMKMNKVLGYLAGKDPEFKGLYKIFGCHLEIGLDQAIGSTGNRAMWFKSGNLMNEAAGFNPLLYLETFKYYRKGLFWNYAAAAAQKYSDFWKGKNDFLAEYWEDMSKQMISMIESKDDKVIGKIANNYDVDKIIEDLTAAGVIEPVKVSGSAFLSGKNRWHECQSVAAAERGNDAGNDDEMGMDADDNVDKKADAGCAVRLAGSSGEKEDSDNSGHIPEEAVVALTGTLNAEGSNQHNPEAWISVREKKNGSNRKGKHCIANSAEEAAGEDGTGSWKTLLSRNWNPSIKRIVWFMHLARAESDLDKEEQMYNLLFRLKNKTGKQRLELERGWTELHKFYSVFKTGTLPESLRKQGSKWVNKALNTYFFPVLRDYVQFMGCEVLNIQDPEAVRDAIFKRLKDPELSVPKDNQEIRHYFRCLFSSIGHAYSLRAMLRPERGEDDNGNRARLWYSLKRIDLNL